MGHGRGRLSWMVVGLVIGVSSPVMAQYGAPANGEWPTYGGDLGSTRYSQLDQIHGDNFADLEVMWRFKTANLGPYPDFNYQATPLMVEGVLYAKDMLRYIGKNDQADFQVRQVLREALMVPETKPVRELLAEFKANALY